MLDPTPSALEQARDLLGHMTEALSQEGAALRHPGSLAELAELLTEATAEMEWVDRGLGEWRDRALTTECQLRTSLATARLAVKHLHAVLHGDSRASEAAYQDAVDLLQVLREVPSLEDAKAMGATGGLATELERQAFEAWVRGHCWELGALWDGSTYRGAGETNSKCLPYHLFCNTLK